MEIVQEAMKKQFNKKRRNPQELKVGDNMWLENKNIHSNKPLKKLDQKRYVLQLKDLRVSQWEEPCIGLTQENSIENSIQDSLPYIPWTHGLC